MFSLPTIFFPNPNKYNDCYRLAPLYDIIGGIALLIIGALMAAGIIASTCGMMCGLFAWGSWILGAGTTIFIQVIKFRHGPIIE